VSIKQVDRWSDQTTVMWCSEGVNGAEESGA